MKLYQILVLCFLVCISCKQKEHSSFEIADVDSERKVLIDSVEVLKEELELNPIEGKWYYKGEAFSGYALKFHSNDTLGEKLGFQNGKREGLAQQWSENGVLRVASYYTHNRLDNLYRTWWENGVLASEVNYEEGVKQGLEREWYPDGSLAKQRELVNGNEKGLQKAWLPNGSLYVNYEARNGRIFGMRRANSCYQLEDEKIIENERL